MQQFSMFIPRIDKKLILSAWLCLEHAYVLHHLQLHWIGSRGIWNSITCKPTEVHHRQG